MKMHIPRTAVLVFALSVPIALIVFGQAGWIASGGLHGQQQEAIEILQSRLPLVYKLNDDGDVVSLSSSSPEWTDAESQLLHEFPQLKRLHLPNASVTDSGLRTLPQLTQLQSLNLDRSAITDDGMNDVAQVTSLRDLSLVECSISDRGVALLNDLPMLQSLRLSGTDVTDQGWRSLGTNERLTAIYLDRTEVNGDPQVLGDLEAAELTILNLSGTQLAAEFPGSLRGFRVWNCSISTSPMSTTPCWRQSSTLLWCMRRGSKRCSSRERI